MKKFLLIPLLIVLVSGLIFGGCAASPSPSTPTPTPAPIPAPGIVIPAPAPYPEKVPITAEGASMADVGESWATERMIVRTGEMSLVVNDVPAVLAQITELAEGFGGYVVSSQRWKEEERLAGIITIRVPVEDFSVVMEALRGLAVDVTHEDTSSKDVTEEYVDLSAKLGNLEATEEQLLRLMEKAETVEDILSVQRELSKTRGEIEQTKGRMQYLERTSATSLVRVQLNEAELGVNFTASKKRVKEGERVEFEVRIAGGFEPYSYEWDFGDGETSTSKYPTHAYKATGSYTVSLKVTDDEGNDDTETRSEYITVTPGWSAGSVASGARNGLVAFGHALANIFIWLGIFSPVWIVIGGIIYWRRRRRRKKASS